MRCSHKTLGVVSPVKCLHSGIHVDTLPCHSAWRQAVLTSVWHSRKEKLAFWMCCAQSSLHPGAPISNCCATVGHRDPVHSHTLDTAMLLTKFPVSTVPLCYSLIGSDIVLGLFPEFPIVISQSNSMNSMGVVPVFLLYEDISNAVCLVTAAISTLLTSCCSARTQFKFPVSSS